MAIDPIKIPQNVYIEDRIVGPLTLKQIITVAIGCGFSYALYSLLVQTYGKVPLPVTVLAWVPGVLSFVFAFLKINDLSLFRICLLTLERLNKTPVRTWAPRRGIVINIRTFTAPTEKQRTSIDAAESEKKLSQLDELSSILDHSTMPAAAQEDEPMSPLEETVTEEEHVSVPRPVDPSRVSASPLHAGKNTDTLASPSAPATGSVSIFRDISPR